MNARATAGRHSGYTLIELFLTLAVLMIVLGMMMNLANRVRHESADRLTRAALARLAVIMNDYRNANQGHLPPIRPLIQPGQTGNENALKILAWQNDLDLVKFLNIADLAKKAGPGDDALSQCYNTDGADAGLLTDPWGSPIAFMPQQHPDIGLPPDNTFFFVSAGPDGNYLTREDNVYSYEEGSETMNDK